MSDESEHIQELIHGQARLIKDGPQRSRSKSLVIRYDDARVRVVAAKNHVAAALAAKCKADALKNLPQVPTAEVGRELGH